MKISHKRILLFVMIVESILLIGCITALLIVKDAQADKLQEMDAILVSSRKIVYTEMEKAGTALHAYEETFDPAYLSEARSAVGKVSTVCAAYGDSYAYRDDVDTADDIIQEWGIQFLMKLYSYLDDWCTNGVSAEGNNTLSALAEVFQPVPDGSSDKNAPKITFMSLYWNASNASLAEDPTWMNLITYDSGTLQRPDFS